MTNVDTFTKLAPYYQWLFPANDVQVDFIQAACPASASQLWVDIAAGTGQQLSAMLDRNLDTWALELDSTMGAIFQERQAAQSHRLIIGDMKTADTLLEPILPKQAGLVYCIGNSLVHLESIQAIKQALMAFAKLLSPGGALLIQVVNFDRISPQALPKLPEIKRQCPDGKTLTFTRRYELNSNEDFLTFHTKLIVDEQALERQHALYDLKKNTLSRILAELGLSQQTWYGDFKRTPWQQDSPASIVLATRPTHE